MSTAATQDYLAMQREYYAGLVTNSQYDTEAFARSNTREQVVGVYASHEAYDYEGWLLGGVSLPPDPVALEFGCGPGRMLLRMAPFFSRIDGIDISPELVEIARRRCAPLPVPPCLFVTDGQDLPDETAGVYDVAFSVICLQHICVYSVRRRILEGLFRALKPGGLLTFQMGYGPGHAGMIDYYADHVTATATNGCADVMILHPDDVAGDLAQIGFTGIEYALTPTGPGDVHAAWIFVRAVKPAAAESIAARFPVQPMPRAFSPADIAAGRGERARQLHAGFPLSLLVRCAELAERARELPSVVQQRDELSDICALLVAEKGAWQEKTRSLAQRGDELTRCLDIAEQQLRRLKAVDRHRVWRVIHDAVEQARANGTSVGVFGAGAFAVALLRETCLATAPGLCFFDSRASATNPMTLDGRPVAPVDDIPTSGVRTIIVASLAFPDEMTARIRALSVPGLHVVRLYP